MKDNLCPEWRPAYPEANRTSLTECVQCLYYETEYGCNLIIMEEDSDDAEEAKYPQYPLQ